MRNRADGRFFEGLRLSGDNFFQINHIAQQFAILNDRVVVVLSEKIGQRVRVSETTALVERYGVGTVARADEYSVGFVGVVVADEIDHCAAVTFTLVGGRDSKVFQLEGMVVFTCYNCNCNSYL